MTSAANPGAAVASMVVASATARMATPGALAGAFAFAGMQMAKKRVMWSSHREFAGCAGMVMIEAAGCLRAKQADGDHKTNLPACAGSLEVTIPLSIAKVRCAGRVGFRRFKVRGEPRHRGRDAGGSRHSPQVQITGT